MYRFMLSVRWLGFAVFVIALAAVCTRLGFWQMHKLDLRLDRNDAITKHFAAEPVDVTTVLSDDTEVDGSNEWTRITARGTYDLEHELSVKFVTRDAPGVDIVTPLVLPSGQAVLVDRGWMGTDRNVEKPNAPAPPTGEVTIEGWLRKDSGAGRTATVPDDEGQIRAVSSEVLADHVPYELLDGYVNLQVQTPEAAEPLAVEPKPELGQGPHFFYALQWWFFALLAIVGYFWFARAEARERRNPTRIDGFALPADERQASVTRSR